MPRKELRAYFKWFMDQIPIRLIELTHAVQDTPGFEHRYPDFTPESLDLLGDWFAQVVETRPRTAEEMKRLQDDSSFPIEFPTDDLTNRTFSLAMDIGMYLGQVFQRSVPNLKWELMLGGKRYIDYGQPVLVEFRVAPLNPVRLVVVFAYKLADKNPSGDRLRELYEIWSDYVIK